MAGLGSLIYSLHNLCAELLPQVKNSFFSVSSLSSAEAPDALPIEVDLTKLMRLLERIKAILYDAEETNGRDESFKLWLKDLREHGQEAEYVLEDYMYEVYNTQAEAKNCEIFLTPRMRKLRKSYADFVRACDGMENSIRGITSRFEEIVNKGEALCLQEDAPKCIGNERPHAPTRALVVEQKVFGREEEKRKVIHLLFLDYNQKQHISVLPIVGEGGLGKTTVARLVYNDKRVRDRFDMLGWVYVSDNFSIERITRDVIESLTKTGCNIENLSVLLEELARRVEGKRVFLVLDGVRNVEPSLWELLCMHLMPAKIATILVTTGNVSVARIIQTMEPFQLPYLSDDKCWHLFTHYAFHGIDTAKQSNLVEIGKEIVKKCRGLPLAVKSIASLLRYEAEAQSWIEILQSDLWELDSNQNEIPAALQISYERLPMYLQPCLLLCSMFPKGYEYDMDHISRLWIANGYIEPKERKQPEEVAIDYARELHERSFFYDFKARNCVLHSEIRRPEFAYRARNFRLHDMVHDLAWLNSNKTCYSVKRGISKEILHLYLSKDSNGPLELLGSINMSDLQTLFMRYPWFYSNGKDQISIGLTILSKAKRLRALDYVNNVKDHPFPLKHLKHIRYLSFHGEYMKQVSLPFIFSCYNLRMLILNTKNYIDLRGIGNLVNLEFLQIHDSSSIFKLPESLGLLNKLRVLEINNHQLRNYSFSELPESIGNLIELHRIVIIGSMLRKLPESFCKLTSLKELILRCDYLEELSENFGNLTSLQFLLLQRSMVRYLPVSCTKFVPRCTMNVYNLRSQPESSHGAVGWLKEFSDLKGDLWIHNICNLSLDDARNASLVCKHNLETLLLDWSDIFSVRSNGQHSVKYVCPTEYTIEKGMLDISICNPIHQNTQNPFDILETFQPHHNLKHLYIGSYCGSEFPRWMGESLSCASLVKLCIRSCSLIIFLPLGSIISLKQLHIHDCGSLRHLKRESLPCRLKHLTISCCNQLEEVALLGSLVKLYISSCTRLKSLPPVSWKMSALKAFPSLKQITILSCPLIQANYMLVSMCCDVYILDSSLGHYFRFEGSDYKLLRFSGRGGKR